MKRLLAMVLAALPAGAAAQADDTFCADLRRAMATQFEAGSYRPGWQAPNYRLFEQCTAFREGFEDQVTCTWRLPAPEPSTGQLAAAVLRCLPAARRLAEVHQGGDMIRLGHELRIIAVGRQGDQGRLVVIIPEG